MEILVNIWLGVTNYWRLVAEISILSVAFYYTLKFFRGTRGWPMVVALLGLIGATLLCAALKLTVLSALLTSLFGFSAFFFGAATKIKLTAKLLLATEVLTTEVATEVLTT